MSNFPVFSLDRDGALQETVQGPGPNSSGVSVGGQQPSRFQFRDRAGEAIQAEKNGNAIIAAVYPARWRAMQAQERAEAEVTKYRQLCFDLSEKLRAVGNRCNGSLTAKMNAEEYRRQSRELTAQYDEAFEELEAAEAELITATAKVDQLVEAGR
jgi:hypothetical protein